MKKAIKIDSENQKLEYITIGDDYREISSAIGNNCGLFTCIYLDDEDAMYCDDDSLLRPSDIKGGFLIEGWNTPIVGNAIILGTDEDGDSSDCHVTIEELGDNIKFLGADMCIRYANVVMSQPRVFYEIK